MKSRLLIIIGIIIVLTILTVIIIPELWMDYFSYPQIDADMVCMMNGGQWNGTGDYCDGITDICEQVGGKRISWSIPSECGSDIVDTGDSRCSGGLIRISCVFP